LYRTGTASRARPATCGTGRCGRAGCAGILAVARRHVISAPGPG
jgi:hypothetical protein